LNNFLELKNLVIGYRKPLSKPINLSVGEYGLTGLLGINGIGKTTLLKTIANLVKPFEGEVLFRGKKLSEYSIKVLARYITYTNNIMFRAGMLVSDFLELAFLPYSSFPEKLRDKKIAYIAEKFEIVDLLSKRMEQLSDGQRQLINIARILLQDTEIVLLDEPFNFLDIKNIFFVLGILKEFSLKGKFIIFSTHQLRIALQYSDFVWVIKDGELLYGVPEQMALNNVFDNLFHTNNIIFSHKEMDFQINQNHKQYKIQLIFGKDHKRNMWTERFLYRKGFQIVSDAEVSVKIDKEYWFLQTKKETFTFKDLGGLSRKLNELYNISNNC